MALSDLWGYSLFWWLVAPFPLKMEDDLADHGDGGIALMSKRQGTSSSRYFLKSYYLDLGINAIPPSLQICYVISVSFLFLNKEQKTFCWFFIGNMRKTKKCIIFLQIIFFFKIFHFFFIASFISRKNFIQNFFNSLFCQLFMFNDLTIFQWIK